MTEIEQLRQDIEQTKEIMFRFYKQDRQALGLGEMFDRLAKLEAEENAKADPWAEEKRLVKVNLEAWVEGSVNHRMASFSTYLQQRVAELEAKIEKMQTDYKATYNGHQTKIVGLQAELAKRPVVYCMKNNLTGIYGKHFGLDRIALFDIENPDVLAEWQSEPYTGEQS